MTDQVNHNVETTIDTGVIPQEAEGNIKIEGNSNTGGNSQEKTWVDEIEVAGNQLVDRIKDLYQEGNARRVIIRNSDGHELMSLPLTVGVIAGGLVTLANIGFAAVIAAVGAIAALVTKVKLEVIRSEEPEQLTAGADATEESKH